MIELNAYITTEGYDVFESPLRNTVLLYNLRIKIL